MLKVLARGIPFNVVRMGQGEPLLVFIHSPLIGNHSGFYMSIAPALAKHASVILYDLRGHGRSGQPLTGYGVDDMAHDLAALLDVLVPAGERVVVVGHSFGGHVALRFAALHPQRLRGLVLLDAHCGAAEFGQQMAETLLLEGEQRDRKIEELFGRWLVKHATRSPADGNQPGLDQLDDDGRSALTFIKRLKKRRQSPLVATAERLRDHTSFVEDIAATTGIDDAALARIECPVLALYGEDSDLRPTGARIAATIPRSRVEIIPGCAHDILFRGTAHVRNAMIEWLAEIGA